MFGKEDNKGGKNYYKRRGVLILIVTVAAAIMAFGLNMWSKNYTIAYIFIVMSMATMDSIANEQRYFTRQTIITDNRQFSYNASARYDAGNMTAVEIGGINVEKWPARHGGEGTIIVPNELVEEQGENIRIYGIVHRVRFSEIDEEAKDVVRDHNLGEPYYQTYEMTVPGLDKIDHLFEDIDIDKLEEGKYPEKTEQAIKTLVDKLDAIDTRLEQLQGTVTKKQQDKDDRIDGLVKQNREKMKDIKTAAETGKAVRGPDKTERIKRLFTGDKEEPEKRR